jgi:hypothetical protein
VPLQARAAGHPSLRRTRVAVRLSSTAELAAEIRSLSQGRAEAPRQGPARGIARLRAERDSLAARLEKTEAELAATRAAPAPVSSTANSADPAPAFVLS